MIPLHLLPSLNACLNATSAIVLSIGYLCIRSKNILAHKMCMVTAVMTSGLFLTSYLTYHFLAGATHFGGKGWIRPLYFTILVGHTILAVAIVPLVIITLWRALHGRFDRHAAIARWTLPLWLTVCVTGVLVFFLLSPYYAPSP